MCKQSVTGKLNKWRNKNNLLQKLKRCKFLSQQAQPVFCEMLVFSCHIMQMLAGRFEDNISESSVIYTTSEKGLERGIECYLCNRSLTWFAISCEKELGGPSHLVQEARWNLKHWLYYISNSLTNVLKDSSSFTSYFWQKY